MVSTSSFIAKRYFRSKKKQHFITLLSSLAVVGVAVSTMALVVVMSVFNGLEEVIRGLFASFDSELKITPTQGKSFEVSEEFLMSIAEVEGVEEVVEVIEDNALLEYRGYQQVARVKAVSSNFLDEGRFSKGYFWGDTTLGSPQRPGAILGRGLAHALSVNLGDFNAPLTFYYPKSLPASVSLDPSRLYTQASLEPRGFFSIEQGFDNGYVLVPLEFFQHLLDYGSKRTALEINVKEGNSMAEVQSLLRQHLGAKFAVKNADEQHATLLRTVKLEKLFVFLTLTFLLALSSFNIFFSLSMLAIEKKKDIGILKSMGAPQSLIRAIFLKQGAMIALVGAGIGLALGILLVLLQQEFGLISLGISSGVIDAYPVKIKVLDLLGIGLVLIGITLVVSWRPAWIASQVDPLEAY
jgi:lipoprotein-releasing system permease protein